MNKLIIALGIAASVALPAGAFAQTYAYVNTAGEVMTTEAASADAALMTAPNLHVHSGVMLVGSDDTDVIGDDVPGA